MPRIDSHLSDLGIPHRFVISVKWYDGPLEGVFMPAETGQLHTFRLLWWNGDLSDRAFALQPCSLEAQMRLEDAMASHGVAEDDPYLIGRIDLLETATEDISKAIDACMDTAHGPVWVRVVRINWPEVETLFDGFPDPEKLVRITGLVAAELLPTDRLLELLR